MENEAIQFAYFIAEELNNHLNITNLTLIFLIVATIIDDFITLKYLAKKAINIALKEFKIPIEFD